MGIVLQVQNCTVFYPVWQKYLLTRSLAVTGSVNQKGEIQAIGGVTYKIEGSMIYAKKEV